MLRVDAIPESATPPSRIRLSTPAPMTTTPYGMHNQTMPTVSPTDDDDLSSHHSSSEAAWVLCDWKCVSNRKVAIGIEVRSKGREGYTFLAGHPTPPIRMNKAKPTFGPVPALASRLLLLFFTVC